MTDQHLDTYTIVSVDSDPVTRRRVAELFWAVNAAGGFEWFPTVTTIGHADDRLSANRFVSHTLVTDTDQLVAHAGLAAPAPIDGWSPPDGYQEIAKVMVSAGHRCRGLGRDVTLAAAAHATQLGHPGTYLCALAGTAGLYEQLGYTTVHDTVAPVTRRPLVVMVRPTPS